MIGLIQSHSDIFLLTQLITMNSRILSLHDMSAYRAESDGRIIHTTGYLGHMAMKSKLYSKRGETLDAYRLFNV